MLIALNKTSERNDARLGGGKVLNGDGGERFVVFYGEELLLGNDTLNATSSRESGTNSLPPLVSALLRGP